MFCNNDFGNRLNDRNWFGNLESEYQKIKGGKKKYNNENKDNKF